MSVDVGVDRQEAAAVWLRTPRCRCRRSTWQSWRGGGYGWRWPPTWRSSAVLAVVAGRSPRVRVHPCGYIPRVRVVAVVTGAARVVQTLLVPPIERGWVWTLREARG